MTARNHTYYDVSYLLTLPVHPAADFFPYYGTDGCEDDTKLTDLVKSIEARGILNPLAIWWDPDSTNPEDPAEMVAYLLDGRNRLAAADLAGVEEVPVIEIDGAVDDTDPLDYIIDQNLTRRNLTPAQRAVIAAKIANTAENQAMRAERRSAAASVGHARQSGQPYDMADLDTLKRTENATIERIAATIGADKGAVAAAIQLMDADTDEARATLIAAGAGKGSAESLKRAAKALKPVSELASVKMDDDADIAVALEMFTLLRSIKQKHDSGGGGRGLTLLPEQKQKEWTYLLSCINVPKVITLGGEEN